MIALYSQDQGTIVLLQQDYVPMMVESFLIDRKAKAFPLGHYPSTNRS
jgi:hypothetical protein